MTRRNKELLLLALSAPVVLLAYALVRAAEGGFTAAYLGVPAGLLGAFAAAHIAVRMLAPDSDPVLLPIACTLSGLGIAVITRLDPQLATAQVLWLFAGIGAFIGTLVLVRSLEDLARYKYTLMLSGLVLLLTPALIGREVNGARLWLRFAGMSFQPGEVAKLLVVLFLAAYLAENRAVLSISTRRVLGLWMPPLRQLAPLILMWVISLVILVAEKDLGSSLLFFGIFLAMVYTATGNPAYVVTGLGLFSAGAFAAWRMFGHVQTRVSIWLDPFADAAGKGYQLVQSLFGLAAGGVAGLGIGKGMPERIPFVTTDFVFAAVGEELGLLGASALLLLCLVFCTRGLATAARARSDVAAFTAAGLTAAFGFQVFVIAGGVTRLIPLTGITFPFVSYGGSSLLANFALLALLLRAGDAGVREEVPLASLSAKLDVLGRVALWERLGWLARLQGVLIAALVVNLTVIQVFAAPRYAAMPANTRSAAQAARVHRGEIRTADGVVLAKSARTGSTFIRQYPRGRLAAHVVGYADARIGVSGIEAARTEVLTGAKAHATLQDLIDSSAGRTVRGNDVVLTIDSRIQKAAENSLRGHRGACVVLDTLTGDIVALASAPAYEPSDVRAQWDRLTTTKSGPLVNRATTALYPPGSTFKLVTYVAALGSGVATQGSVFKGPGRMDIGGAPVTNFEGGSYGALPLETALAKSVNTVFGQLAVRVGARALVDQAEAFGFGKAPDVEILSKPSLMPEPEEMTEWELAWSGVGQPVGEHESPAGPQATPLQMALVAAGVASDGTVLDPRLVAKVIAPDGTVLAQGPTPARHPVTDPISAAAARAAMRLAVTKGSARKAALESVPVGGKTGTAEVGKGLTPHAWFVGLAPAGVEGSGAPRFAIALVLENAGTGGSKAAPAAREVLRAALATLGTYSGGVSANIR